MNSLVIKCDRIDSIWRKFLWFLQSLHGQKTGFPFPAWALASVINWLTPCMYCLSVRDKCIHSRSISAQKKYWDSNYKELIRNWASWTIIVARKYHFWKTLLYTNYWKIEIGSPKLKIVVKNNYCTIMKNIYSTLLLRTNYRITY